LPGTEARLADNSTVTRTGDLVFDFRLAAETLPNAESHSITRGDWAVMFSAANNAGLLHAVFDFPERQGAFFGMDGESHPIAPAAELRLPPANQP
jgi:hypothetical protein